MQTRAITHMHKALHYSKLPPERDHTFPLPKTPAQQAPVGRTGAACPAGVWLLPRWGLARGWDPSFLPPKPVEVKPTNMTSYA